MKKLLLLAIVLVGFASVQAQDYQRSIGIRAAWNYGLSYKHFINENAALEAVLTFRFWGVPGFTYNNTRIMGLYQHHMPIDGVDGLKWYVGGGASVGFWGGDFARWASAFDNSYSTVDIGIHPVVGLDYMFSDVPINLSLDFMPSIIIGGWYNGFRGSYGGFSGRYIF
jgi:hypothetical protein